MFNASDYQAAVVAEYLSIAAALPKFPPNGTFPPMGRATPDLSGLGEGYLVYSMNATVVVGGCGAQ